MQNTSPRKPGGSMQVQPRARWLVAKRLVPISGLYTHFAYIIYKVNLSHAEHGVRVLEREIIKIKEAFDAAQKSK